MTYIPTLLPMSEFVLDKMVLRNALKFTIFWNSKEVIANYQQLLYTRLGVPLYVKSKSSLEPTEGITKLYSWLLL